MNVDLSFLNISLKKHENKKEIYLFNVFKGIIYYFK